MTNLSGQGNMFPEISYEENVDEINEGLSRNEFGIGDISFTPTPHESLSFHVGTDESTIITTKFDVSSADLLLQSSGFLNISNCLEEEDTVVTNSIEADGLDSNGQPYLFGHGLDEGKGIGMFISSDFDSMDAPSSQRNGICELSHGTAETCKPNLPLIVYKSSQRSGCKTNSKQNDEFQKASYCGRVTSKNSVVDLNSLQILRKNRTTFSKRARSSVWGCLGNILPESKEKSRVDLNLGNKKKPSRVGRGKGKTNSLVKRFTPIGPISLKIKIGNRVCSLGDSKENFSASQKDVPKLFDITENKLGEEVPGVVVLPPERNLGKAMSPEFTALTTHLDVMSTHYNQSFNSSSDLRHIIGVEDGHNLGVSVANLSLDVGTSPDSEVINIIPDAPLCDKGLPNMQGSPMASKGCVSPSDMSTPISLKKSKKGNQKGKPSQVDKCILGVNLIGAETSNNMPISIGDVSSSSVPKTKSKKEKKKDKLHKMNTCHIESKQNGFESKSDAKVPADLGECQNVGDATFMNSMPCIRPTENNPSSGFVTGIASQVCEALVPCTIEQKFPKCSRGKGGGKDRSKIMTLPGSKGKPSKKKENKNSVGGKNQRSEKVGVIGVLSKVESCQATEPPDVEENGALNNDLTRPSSMKLPSSGLMDYYLPSRNAWVLCDECQKWRRIEATLADHIEETNCRWTCEENTDIDFADCSVPQEMSDSEINEELEISGACEDVSCGAFPKYNQNQPKVSQASTWSLIKSNLFLHRCRKTQTIDEVMVCHCKPPSDGRMGCGAKCLNRMLNIECVQGTCPCGELCSNQQFQKRNYAKLKWIRCGKKGYGLQALGDIYQGQFIIEYVGEVLDVHDYEARQKEYALNGHRHFYFMTLNGSEVIDACAKGNLGRFINHSCNPNCRTEKWMVNGEVCVGLFCLRDIKKGEEITFDYNYVRVFGAAAKKCVCGSTNCRGYIGGDRTNSEVIVQDDSDDEYSEPIMTCGDSELDGDWREIMSNFSDDGERKTENEPAETRYNREKLTDVGENIELHIPACNIKKLDSTVVLETVVSDKFGASNSTADESVEQLDNKIIGESLNSSGGLLFQTDGTSDKKMSSIHELATNPATHSKSLSNSIESKKLKHATVRRRDEPAKSNSLPKFNRISSTVKRGKLKIRVMNEKVTPEVEKLNTELQKSKKPTENGHIEAVEEKLNELLDPEGGISKRKDASRGYLKLLFLTAASGSNGHGEAIQSNRDLSMILDVLLKTKSRTVLVDIINKNGLQMLHNIMKRYRKDFIKTPILRKLLKVLEHLALREIVTLEHITGGPPCVGVESFKDSILILTEHTDRQVHQIARNFRDRWIPRSLRRTPCMERDDVMTDFNQRSSSVGVPVSNDHWSDKGGDIKPSGTIYSYEKQSVSASGTGETSTRDPSVSGSSNGMNGTKTRKRKSRWDNPAEEYPSRAKTNWAGEGQLNVDEDAPPGFSSPCNGSLVPPNASFSAIHQQEMEVHVKQLPSDVVLGESHSRFVARMPVSYAVPYSVMQQLGVRGETSEGWTVAPGVPFIPFPPLPPPHACGETNLPTPTTRCASVNENAENLDQNITRTEHIIPVANGQPNFQRGPVCNLGRKYFRQQKWSQSKLAPPWVRMRNNWGYADLPGVGGLGNGNN